MRAGINIFENRLDQEWQHHMREVVQILHPVFGPTAIQTAAIWWIGQGKVSKAIIEAGVAFALETNKDPQVALIRKIPAQVQEFVELKGITLVHSGWVPENFVVVTAGGMWSGLPAYRIVEKGLSA